MRFSVVNLGCKVNRVESDFYEKAFHEKGCVECVDNADVVVVNTCTVTGEAEKKTRKAVRQALRKHPHAKVIVTGCASAVNPGAFSDMSDRVTLVSKHDSFDYITSWASSAAACSFAEAPCAERSSGGTLSSASGFGHRTRVGVKVQDGCDNACTYCIVHVARGRAVSRPIDEVVREVVHYAEAGAREIVLSGINIGSYDCEGNRLTELLKLLLDRTESLHADGEPPVRFRVSSIEPNDVSDSFIELLSRSNGRVCRHLHLPLQSGSSKVLREMARPYDAEDYKRLIDYIRALVPDMSLSTDIIVGFPGETEDEFRETMDLARYCAFSKIHVFPYSMREGTPAAQRPDQVNPEVKSRRASELRSLSDELRLQDYRSRAGNCEFVLVEQSGRAMTESYFEVQVPESYERGALLEITLPVEFCVDGKLAE